MGLRQQKLITRKFPYAVDNHYLLSIILRVVHMNRENMACSGYYR